MSKQKGQGVIEFALVLPLLMLIIMGMCYFGMAFSDYLMLNETARSAAGEAAVSDCKTDTLQDIEDSYNENMYMPFKFFTADVAIKANKSTKNIEVTVNYQLSQGTWLGRIMTNMTAGESSFSDTSQKHIYYKMYSPNISGSSS